MNDDDLDTILTRLLLLSVPVVMALFVFAAFSSTSEEHVVVQVEEAQVQRLPDIPAARPTGLPLVR